MPAPRTPSPGGAPPGLVALDVDGTLLDPGGVLPERRVEALAALRDAGVAVVLATGKTWPSVTDLCRQLTLPGPHVCCNGSAIVAGDGTVLSAATLDPDVVADVSAALTARGVAHALYLDDGRIVATPDHPDLEAIADAGEARPTVVAGAPVDHGVLKILSVVHGGGDQDGEAALRGLGAGRTRVQRTSPRFLEWNPPHVDKGTGLTRVAERLGVDLARTVAVGDAENDVSMFAAAGVGVAVGAAPPGVVAAADVHLAGRDLTDYLHALARGTVGP